jgi:glycosyltransferase involved in cell wall biosynthesis
MINGCIPIVSPVGAMPHIAGNLGFVVKKRDPESFCSAIRSALSLSKTEREQQSKLSAERISNNFPESKRAESLMKIIALNSTSKMIV